jgi:flagellar basal body-associated protein FliL
MKNDSFLSRIPLPVIIIVWLGLVALGAVLVYTVFFNKPADSTAQAPVQQTPIAQATKPVKPAATQAAQPGTQPAPAPPNRLRLRHFASAGHDLWLWPAS